MGVRLSIGRLVASPLFTIFSVLSLAAGIALTTAVYSVVDALLLADAGVTDPGRVGALVTPYGGRAQRSSVSDPDYDDLRRAQTSFASLSAAAAIQSAVATTSNPEIVTAEAVDGTYFTTLGVGAALGRVIGVADDEQRSRVAVLSHEFWRSRFAGDPLAIGREIRINGQAFEVIGVTAARYRGIFGALLSTRVWIPRATEALLGPSATPRRDVPRLFVFGRLAEGRSIAEASAELGTIAARLDRDYPTPGAAAIGDRRWSASSFAESSEIDRGLRRFGMMILVCVGTTILSEATRDASIAAPLRVEAAGAMDAQNAPTAPCKTTERFCTSSHTLHSFVPVRKNDEVQNPSESLVTDPQILRRRRKTMVDEQLTLGHVHRGQDVQLVLDARDSS